MLETNGRVALAMKCGLKIKKTLTNFIANTVGLDNSSAIALASLINGMVSISFRSNSRRFLRSTSFSRWCCCARSICSCNSFSAIFCWATNKSLFFSNATCDSYDVPEQSNTKQHKETQRKQQQQKSPTTIH
jgi:hypothetical protein